MRKFLLLLSFLFFSLTTARAATRYWIHKVLYENQFSTASQLGEWNLVEDNGTGGFTLSANGTAILKMDNAAGNFANRIFSVDGGSVRLLPLDRANGRVEINIKAITGGNQRIFVQAEVFNASNSYIGQLTILPAQSNTGFFSINFNAISWPVQADKIRLIIGGENYSGQQGTLEFDYFSYSNGNGNWSNTANWSETSNGVAGASVPGAGDIAVFDGAGGANGSCIFDGNISLNSLQVSAAYLGNIDQQAYNLAVSTGGVSLQGGGLTASNGTITIDGNLTVNNGVLRATGGTMELHGNFLLYNTVFNAGIGTIKINGTGTQQLMVPDNSFYNLTVDKPSGTVDLLSDVSAANTLTLTNGIVNTNLFVLGLGTGTATPGTLVSGNGRINGRFRRWLAASTTGVVAYPLGTDAVSAAFVINVVTAPSSGGSVDVAYIPNSPAFNQVSFPDGSATITRISSSYWNLSAAGVSGGSFSFSASAGSLAAFDNLNDLHLVNGTGVTGTHVAATGTAGSPVLNRTGLAAAALSRSYYAGVASQSLPLSWLNFAVQRSNGLVLISWQTADEVLVDHFDVEISPDGIHFNKQGSAQSKGAGSNRYEFSVAGSGEAKTYARITAVDKDGKVSQTPIKWTQDLDAVTFKVSPVPARDRVTLSFLTPLSDGRLYLYNGDGQLLMIRTVSGTLCSLDVSSFPGGMYHLKLVNGLQQPLFQKSFLISR